MRALVLALLVPGLASAACPPAKPQTWGDVGAGLRAPNLDVVLSAKDVAAVDPLVGRIRDVGGHVTRVAKTKDGVHLQAWLEGGGKRLNALLRPGRLTLHAVNEGGMRADLKAAQLPAGVRLTDLGDRVVVTADDPATLRAALAPIATPRGQWLVGSNGREHEAVLANPAALSDADVDRCSVELQTMEWGPQIAVRLTPAGAERFATLTRENVQRRIAIALDGALESAPVVMEPITGGALVLSTGGGDLAEARDLAAVLRHGPLPAGLEVARVPGP